MKVAGNRPSALRKANRPLVRQHWVTSETVAALAGAVSVVGAFFFSVVWSGCGASFGYVGVERDTLILSGLRMGGGGGGGWGGGEEGGELFRNGSTNPPKQKKPSTGSPSGNRTPRTGSPPS